MSASPRLPYGWGSWAQTARFMTDATGEEWTRQRIYSAWSRRDANGFPGLCDVRGVAAFRMEDVLTWYYARKRRGSNGRKQHVPDRC